MFRAIIEPCFVKLQLYLKRIALLYNNKKCEEHYQKEIWTKILFLLRISDGYD